MSPLWHPDSLEQQWRLNELAQDASGDGDDGADDVDCKHWGDGGCFVGDSGPCDTSRIPDFSRRWSAQT